MAEEIKCNGFKNQILNKRFLILMLFTLYVVTTLDNFIKSLIESETMYMVISAIIYSFLVYPYAFFLSAYFQLKDKKHNESRYKILKISLKKTLEACLKFRKELFFSCVLVCILAYILGISSKLLGF